MTNNKLEIHRIRCGYKSQQDFPISFSFVGSLCGAVLFDSFSNLVEINMKLCLLVCITLARVTGKSHLIPWHIHNFWQSNWLSSDAYRFHKKESVKVE